MRVPGQVGAYHRRFGRIGQVLFDVVKSENALDCGYVQIAVAIGDARRQMKTGGNDMQFLRLVIFVEHECMDFALLHRADIQHVIVAQRHFARVRDARQHFDMESGRQLDAFEW